MSEGTGNDPSLRSSRRSRVWFRCTRHFCIQLIKIIWNCLYLKIDEITFFAVRDATHYLSHWAVFDLGTVKNVAGHFKRESFMLHRLTETSKLKTCVENFEFHRHSFEVMSHGTILLEEEPYAHVLVQKQRGLYCDRCLNRCVDFA